MDRPVKRRRLSAREVAFRVAAALRECATEHVAPVEPDAARFETCHGAILLDHAETTQGTNWCVDVDLDAAIRTALATRTTAETLNALAHCEGYEPEEAPRFWREEIAKLSYAGLAPDRLHVITRETLAHYRIYCGFHDPLVDTERLARVLFAAISPFPGSEAIAVRERAIALWGGFLVYRHVPGEVSMEICTSPNTSTSGVCWSLVRSTMFHLSRQWASSMRKSPSASRYAVKLIANTGQRMVTSPLSWKSRHESRAIDHEGLRELAEIATMEYVAITELSFKIEVVDEATISAFRRLMRALVRANTLRAIALQFRFYDDRYAAAVCSALPMMRSLKSCTLQFQALQSRAVADLNSMSDPGSYYSWLYYVMSTSNGGQLSLQFDVTPEASQKIVETTQATHILAPGLAALRRVKLVLQPNGTMAKLAPTASLSTARSPAVASATDISFIAEQNLEPPGWVEVIALLEAKAVIVVPGIGMMWVDASSLTEWRRIPDKAKPAPCVTTKQLTLQARQLVDAVNVTKLIGTELTSLSFRKCSTVTNELFEDILNTCPQLEKIGFLDAEVDGFMPLHDAYNSAQGCRIKSIVYHPSRHVCHNSLIISAFRHGLQELSIDAQLSMLDQRDLYRMLTADRTVRYLRSRAPEHSEATKSYEDLRDAPLQPSEATKKTAYAFLWVARCQQELVALPLTCLRVIVGFAETPARRHLSYHKD